MSGSRGKGQPTKLTPELQQKFIDALAAGNYLRVAANYAGITYTTFYRWLEKGKTIGSGPYHEFCDAVEKAQADSEVARIERIIKAAKTGIWTADAWYLERRYPERWGRHLHEMTGKDGEALPPLSNITVFLPDNGRTREDPEAADTDAAPESETAD